MHVKTAWQNTTEEYLRKYKKVDASATSEEASAKRGQDTGASNNMVAESSDRVKQKNGGSVNTDEGLIYETLVQMGVHKAAAQSLARQFDAADGLSAEVYAKGVGESFLYGMMNFSEQELHSAQGFAADLSERRRNDPLYGGARAIALPARVGTVQI